MLIPYTLESGLSNFKGSYFDNLGGKDFFNSLGSSATRPQNLNDIHRGFSFYNAQTFIVEFWNGTDWTTPTTHPEEVTLSDSGYGLRFGNSGWYTKRTSLELDFASFRGFQWIDTEDAVTVMNLDANGDLGIGIGGADATQKLHVSGSARITGAIYDSNNEPGTSNQILSTTVTGTDWIDGLDPVTGMDAVVLDRSYADNAAALVDLSSGQVYYNTTSSTFVVLP